MKSKLLLLVFAILGLGMFTVSCSKDDDSPETPKVECTISLELPMNLDKPTLSGVEALLTNVKSGDVVKVANFMVEDAKYKAKVVIPEGTYNIQVQSGIQYLITDNTKVNGQVKSIREGITINAAKPLVDMVLSFFKTKEGFVIEEIFFAGTLTPEGKQYLSDQYIKITNNSSKRLYADGLAVVESGFLTVSKFSYTPDIMSQAMAIQAMYCIPGKGNDVPVEPGKSLVLAINALDHKSTNANSINLLNADFEFYDVSNNPKFQDSDNEKVTNLDKWYCYTNTFYNFHTQGFNAIALAKPEVDSSTYRKEYKYKASYVMEIGGVAYPMSRDFYTMPNSWIVDAVNLSNESQFKWIVTDPSLDAGWSYCGKVWADKNRYGKAVRRKVEKVDNGRIIFKDTNNSSEDFEAEVKPSLMK